MIRKRHAFGMLLGALVVMGAGAPRHALEGPWTPFGVGSWVTHQIREVDGDSVVVYQVRTTLTEIEDGRISLHDEAGSRGTGDRVVVAHSGPVDDNVARDSVVGEQVLVVNGQRFRCRVVRSDLVDVPLCGNDPVDFTRSTSYRWESPGFPQFGGVLRRVTSTGATYHEDGHVESHPDSMIWEVLSLHEPQHIGRRTVDCCVVRTITPDVGSGNPPDTVTTWLSGDVPTMEVRSIRIEHASGRQTTESNAIAFEARK